MAHLIYYFFDASALVKIVKPEEGSDKINQFRKRHDPIYTTVLCFTEALGVLKREYFKKNQKEYIEKVNFLRSCVKSNQIKFERISLNDPNAFYKAADLSDKHKIDLLDAFQLVTLLESPFVGATLITADRDLARAARNERLEVWDCLREPIPTD